MELRITGLMQMISTKISMRAITLFLVILFSHTGYAQLNSGARQFHNSLKNGCEVGYILDCVDNTDLSVAYSLRKLKNNYTGSCVKVRRSSDNTYSDIPFGSNGYMDTVALKNFLNGSTAYVSTWYDQSLLGRHAIQNDITRQPILEYNNTDKNYGIRFDGSNDFLLINYSLQILTNGGKEGSVFIVAKATQKSQHNFGSLSGINRWSIHLNWSNNYAYFDPGHCCTNVRYFNNTSNTNNIAQYSFIRNSTARMLRTNGEEKENTAYSSTLRCTLTTGMAIGAAMNTATAASGFSNSTFYELILFKNGVDEPSICKIEQSELCYW